MPRPNRSPRLPWTIIAALLMSASACAAHAQDLSKVRPGDRVRISSLGLSGVATVLRTDSAALVILPAKGSDSVSVPLWSLRRIEVSRGPRSPGYGAMRGFGVGALLGGVTGAMIGFADGDDRDELISPFFIGLSSGEKAATFAIVFGGLGGAVGAVLGSIAPGERWERLRSVAVTVEPAEHGHMALVASMRF